MKDRTIYALGFFDGVHIGHQALLHACRCLAAEAGGKAGVLTFGNHPDALVQKKTPPLINTPEDRRRLLEDCFSMDMVVELPFDDRMREMPWQDFLRMLRREYGAAGFVCGEDFRFGYRGSGTAEILKQYCAREEIPCTVVPAQTLDGVVVSSTGIRKLLEAGETQKAVEFLGHPHILTGQVIAGRGLGHTIGIPTANLQLPEYLVQPRLGVYACKAFVEGKTYLAVTNIGSRPTVGGHHVTVEPWLLDFDGDLYGKTLTLGFYSFLRPEQKFPDLEQLRREIEKNAEQTRKILEKT